MKPDQFNDILRAIFKELMDEGFKKSSICQRILGSQRMVQFDTFLKGTDLGIKPLSKILENFGFELRLVPVQKNDTDNIILIEELNQEFFEYARILLSESLSESPKTRVKSKKSDVSSDTDTSEVVFDANME